MEPDTLDGTIRLLRRWAALSETQRADMRANAVRCWRNRFDSAGTSRAIVRLFEERSEARSAYVASGGIEDLRPNS